MSQEYEYANMCLHCKLDNKERFWRLTQYEQTYRGERNKAMDCSQLRRLEELDRNYLEKNKQLGEVLCLHCSEAKMHRHNVINCPICSIVQQECQENKDCVIKELQQKCEELRYEADINKKKLEDFKDRMSVEASAELEYSTEIFEDINNPCRESELRKRYEILRLNTWPKCLQKMKEKSNMRREETADERKENEKEKVERMIKNVFEKALIDMKKKKDDMKTFFTISERTKSVPNNKQLQCIAMAIQNLQILILYENVTHYQDVNKELGNKEPDYLCEFADQCYKQGCLMALHNPPMTLDWNNKKDKCGCPFPPTKLG